MTNEVEKKGEIYFKVRKSQSIPRLFCPFCDKYKKNETMKITFLYPTWQDFCMLVLRKFREEDEEEFIKVMFKVVIESLTEMK